MFIAGCKDPAGIKEGTQNVKDATQNIEEAAKELAQLKGAVIAMGESMEKVGNSFEQGSKGFDPAKIGLIFSELSKLQNLVAELNKIIGELNKELTDAPDRVFGIDVRNDQLRLEISEIYVEHNPTHHSGSGMIDVQVGLGNGENGLKHGESIFQKKYLTKLYPQNVIPSGLVETAELHPHVDKPGRYQFGMQIMRLDGTNNFNFEVRIIQTTKQHGEKTIVRRSFNNIDPSQFGDGEFGTYIPLLTITSTLGQ